MLLTLPALFFYKTSYLNEVENRIEPTPSVSVLDMYLETEIEIQQGTLTEGMAQYS
jgi:hypothetical protein